MTPSTPVFHLPDRLAAKADPRLIAADERHLAAVSAQLDRSIAELSARLDEVRRTPGGVGQQALDRDLEVHRLTARLRALRRFGADGCLGRIVRAGGGEPDYIGRFGLTGDDGAALLIDWRAPAAEPFFGATLAEPMGLVSRRRYRWTGGRVTDYWDEALAPVGFEPPAGGAGGGGAEASAAARTTAGDVGLDAALDDQSAFIASLGASRSARMRDVLGTIQADQHAVIRAGSRGVLVVDGGPGTGKTVVALHRIAYLLYSDPRLERSRGGVLLVGPSPAYLSYIEDVLPGLGEEGVRSCTLSELVPEGARARPEADPRVARLKSSARLLDAIENAVARHETPPADGLAIDTPWSELWLSPEEWAEAFDRAEPGMPHNEARDEVWEELLSLLVERHDDDEVPLDALRRALAADEGLRAAFGRAWPVLDPLGVLADLLSVPGHLARCAPWLEPGEVTALQRPVQDARAWTTADLPLLDAARLRIGDPAAAPQRRIREAARNVERERFAEVIDELIAADAVSDDGAGLATMLRGQDAQNSLLDLPALGGSPARASDDLTGPFAHIVVDEAQELTDAEWRMLVRRCPSRSLTVVGDRAQARNGFAESWRDRLQRVGLDRVEVATLSVNYRTPEEVMAVAEPVIRAALPDANVPDSVRRSGVTVRYGAIGELDGIVDRWLGADGDGVAAVIAGAGASIRLSAASPRVRVLTPEQAKGLEFDLVVLIESESLGPGVLGAVDRYVAMTRATRELVVLGGAG